jgi:flagellar protein FliL
VGRKKKADGAADGGEEKAEKKKGNLVPAIVIAVGLILGGKMMGGGGGGAAAATAEPTTTTTEAPGPIEALDAVTLNLADGHYLKVGLALQLHGGEEAAAGGHGAEGEEVDLKVKWAKALDLAIDVFGGKSYGDLVSPEGRELAKMELEKHLTEAYPELVEGVYLTEFVLQ